MYGRLVQLAARNVARKPVRSIVTAGAMALAAAVMIFFGAIMIGYIEHMKTSALAMETAHAQVHALGYRDEPDLHTLMPDSAKIVEKLRKSDLYASERLYGFALAAHGKQSAGVMLRGIDPDHEKDVTLLHTAVGEGKWLDKSDPRGVIVGKKVARRLGLKVGDELIVLSQAADGATADDLLTVRGIFRGVSARLDAVGVVMQQGAFREFLAVYEGAHEIAIRSKAGFDAPIKQLLETTNAAAGKHEVLGWPKLQPALAEMLRTSDAQLGFMLFIAYLAVVTVVLNATLMSVFERMREFGVLKSLGFTPLQIFFMVVAEAMAMAVFASVLALLIGVGVSMAYADGIDLSASVGDMSFNGMVIPPVLTPKLDAAIAVGPVVVLLVMVVAAAIYPALKAALVRPVEAVRGR